MAGGGVLGSVSVKVTGKNLGLFGSKVPPCPVMMTAVVNCPTSTFETFEKSSIIAACAMAWYCGVAS